MKPLFETSQENLLTYQKDDFENGKNELKGILETKHSLLNGRNIRATDCVDNTDKEANKEDQSEININSIDTTNTLHIKNNLNDYSSNKISPCLKNQSQRTAPNNNPPHKNTTTCNSTTTNNNHNTTTNNNQTNNKLFHKNTNKYTNNNQPHYGNYPHYYGYRHSSSDDIDSRVSLMEAQWLHGKEVLDVGCNAGKVTLEVARTFNPRRIVGVDIDQSLIMTAKKNLKQYNQKCSMMKSKEGCVSYKRKRNGSGEVTDSKRFKNGGGDLKGDLNRNSNGNGNLIDNSNGNLNSECLVNDGAKEVKLLCGKDNGVWKNKNVELPLRNIFFIQADYVPDMDVPMTTIVPEFDVILALSVTKWIHLNYGDEGLKKVFEKMYMQLREGGLLVLEPQDWPSYRRKKKMVTQTTNSCKDLHFKPVQFTEYLINSVGFKTGRLLGTSQHPSKGFQRQVILFAK